MSTLAEQMDELATDLAGMDLPATSSPRVASQWRSGAVILVTPPTKDYTARLTTWTLAVLVPKQDASLETTKKIGDVLAALEAAVPTLEEARPGSVLLERDLPPVPAYLVRLTTS